MNKALGFLSQYRCSGAQMWSMNGVELVGKAILCHLQHSLLCASVARVVFALFPKVKQALEISGTFDGLAKWAAWSPAAWFRDCFVCSVINHGLMWALLPRRFYAVPSPPSCPSLSAVPSPAHLVLMCDSMFLSRWFWWLPISEMAIIHDAQFFRTLWDRPLENNKDWVIIESICGLSNFACDALKGTLSVWQGSATHSLSYLMLKASGRLFVRCTSAMGATFVMNRVQRGAPIGMTLAMTITGILNITGVWAVTGLVDIAARKWICGRCPSYESGEALFQDAVKYLRGIGCLHNIEDLRFYATSVASLRFIPLGIRLEAAQCLLFVSVVESDEAQKNWYPKDRLEVLQQKKDLVLYAGDASHEKRASLAEEDNSEGSAEGMVRQRTIPAMCCICMEDLQNQTEHVMLRRCQHWFHASCIAKWLEKNDAKEMVCPVCRQQMCSDASALAPAPVDPSMIPRPGDDIEGLWDDSTEIHEMKLVRYWAARAKAMPLPNVSDVSGDDLIVYFARKQIYSFEVAEVWDRLANKSSFWISLLTVPLWLSGIINDDQ